MTSLTIQRKGWSRKKKAGTEVWCGRSADDIPMQVISELSNEVFASYSGPDRGLAIVPELEPVANMQNGDDTDANSNSPCHMAETTMERSTINGTDTTTTDMTPGYIAGSRQWNIKSRKAYGISMSLYEQHPINGRMSGDPIADSFGICSRTNNSIMIVADGVNWGEKSKLAARCAIYGSMNYINQGLFSESKPISNTQDAFQLLLKAVDQAHEAIIRYGGGQTTLCMAVVLPIQDSRQFAVCIVNVGDSLAYVFSKYHGIREITTGSHDIQSERDIRDAGGAVGPVHGNDPELHNLTCSMTLVDPGDILYLTTDGISDNFDPVVTKIAVASRRRHSDPQLQTLPEEGTSEANVNVDRENDNVRCGTLDGKPEMEPHERHQYAVKEMERIIHEFELFTEQPCSAQELCGALLQHVLKVTDPKRKVLENPDLYGKKLKSKDRKRRDSEIIAKLSKSPGKLDHATLIGYDVGVYHGNEDEDYEIVDSSDEEMTEETDRVSGVDDSNAVVTGDSPDPHDPHDVFLDACDSSHGNALSPVLSPESQKKKNSLKNIRLKIKSRFKSPGRKSRSISDSTPSPNQPEHTPDPTAPSGSTSSTQSSSSLPNQKQRTLELKNAMMKEQERKHEEKRSRRDRRKGGVKSEVHTSSGVNTEVNSSGSMGFTRSQGKPTTPARTREQYDRNVAHASPPPSTHIDRQSVSPPPPSHSSRPSVSPQHSDRQSVTPPAPKHNNRHSVHVSPPLPHVSTTQEHNKRHSIHVSPPPSHDLSHRSHDQPGRSRDRVRGRRELRLSPVQSPTSNTPTSPFQGSTQLTRATQPHPSDISETSSDNDITMPPGGQIPPSDAKETWVIKPKLADASPTGPQSVSPRKARRALQVDVQKASDYGEGKQRRLESPDNRQSRNNQRSNRVQHSKQARRPKDLPNVKSSYSLTASEDSPANQKNDPECEERPALGMNYVLPEVIPYGIDLADIMFIDDVGDSDVDGTQ